MKRNLKEGVGGSENTVNMTLEITSWYLYRFSNKDYYPNGDMTNGIVPSCSERYVFNLG